MTEVRKDSDNMTLGELATACDRLRSAALFGELGGGGPVEDAGLDLLAEQEFLIALSHLELAQRHAVSPSPERQENDGE
jgi:hypothetical protein